MFQCEKCPYATKRSNDLKKHEKNVHQKTKTEKKVKCDFCEFTSNHRGVLNRHLKTCNPEPSLATKYRKLGKLNLDLNINKKIEKAEEKKVFNEKDVIKLVDDCNGSIREIRKVIKWMRNKFGRKFFTPHINEIIKKHVNSLSHLHESEIETFHDKNGDPIETVISKVTDVNLFVNEIASIRNLKNPELILGADGGQDKCIITAIIKDEDNENLSDENENQIDFKPTGSKRVLVLAKADSIPENRYNIEVLWNSLNLNDVQLDFQLVCDLKLTNIILGIQSCTSLYACPFCDSCKENSVTKKPTNGRGRWRDNGSLRTCNTISDNQSEWEIETNSNRSLLKNYKSCEFKPLKFKMCQYDTAVLFLLPPDPLHVNYLGPVNDVFDLLEENFPNELKTFYEKYHLKKSGQGPGGKFHGPSIKQILREDCLNNLLTIIPTEAKQFTDYLRSIRELHKVCTSSELNEYKNVLHDFRKNFDYLYDNFNLNMTLKIHVIFHHYEDYFDMTGKTMKYTNGEFVESCHHTIRQEEESHNFKVVRKVGSQAHKQKSLQSHVWHNSLRAGKVPAEEMRIRRKSSNPK